MFPNIGLINGKSLPALIRSNKADLIKQALHDRMQTPRANIFNTGIHFRGEFRNFRYPVRQLGA